MSYLYAGHQYQIRIYSNSGSVIGVYNDLVSLYYRSIVNSPGMAILTVPVNHPLVSVLADDLIMEIHISYPATVATPGVANWGVDFTGIYRDKQIATDAQGNYYYLLYFPGATEILTRSIVGYRAGTNNESQFTARTAKEIMQQLITMNCTAAATTVNGRVRSINVVNSLGFINLGGAVYPSTTINYSCAYKNVLECLQELSDLSSIDFAVVLVVGISNTNFGVILYPGQLGTDRSTTVIFDVNLDNIKGGNLTGDRLREKTVAIVGGQGEGAARSIAVRTGANYGTTNDYEIFADARGNTNTELNDIGDAKLADLIAKETVQVDIAPGLGYVYRKHYALGDRVTVRFAGISQIKKITEVEVSFGQDRQATIQIRMANV